MRQSMWRESSIMAEREFWTAFQDARRGGLRFRPLPLGQLYIPDEIKCGGGSRRRKCDWPEVIGKGLPFSCITYTLLNADFDCATFKRLFFRFSPSPPFLPAGKCGDERGEVSDKRRGNFRSRPTPFFQWKIFLFVCLRFSRLFPSLEAARETSVDSNGMEFTRTFEQLRTIFFVFLFLTFCDNLLKVLLCVLYGPMYGRREAIIIGFQEWQNMEERPNKEGDKKRGARETFIPEWS